MLKYDIYSFNVEKGVLEVDFPVFGRLLIHLPLDADGNFPNEEELHKLILARYPMHEMKRMKEVEAKGNNAVDVARLVGNSFEVPWEAVEAEHAHPPAPVRQIAVENQLHVEKL